MAILATTAVARRATSVISLPTIHEMMERGATPSGVPGGVSLTLDRAVSAVFVLCLMIPYDPALALGACICTRETSLCLSSVDALVTLRRAVSIRLMRVFSHIGLTRSL